MAGASDNEFCTLFDAAYLPRGLVLYRSLAEVCPNFHLRVFCMDAETKRVLDELALPSLTTVALDELERADPELLAVKPTRTALEYFWTATSAVCVQSFEREPDLESITYLDADLMFFSDPRPLFAEAADADVVITPHRYADRWRHWEATSGTYSVQFVTFRRTERGLRALRWWRERCLEWCYDRFEDGKLGDQKYLDDWTTRFEGVHVLEHPGGGVAPWNVEGHRLERADGRVHVDGAPLVFYHYHSLRTFRSTPFARALAGPAGFRSEDGELPLLWGTSFPISAVERELVWKPYLAQLTGTMIELRGRGVTANWLPALTLRDTAVQSVRARVPSALRRTVSRELRAHAHRLRARR